MARLVYGLLVGRTIARLKQSIDAFCDFDERVNEKFETSGTATMVLLSLAWLSLLVAATVTWTTEDHANTKIVTVICFAFVTGGLIWLARYQIRRQLLKQRLRDGLCSKCGYDIRGSPGRCSECGAVPFVSKANPNYP